MKITIVIPDTCVGGYATFVKYEGGGVQMFSLPLEYHELVDGNTINLKEKLEEE